MFLKQLFEEYLESTTVHGFAYIHERQHWIVRILWFIIIVSGFLVAGILICQAFVEWSEDPVITTLESISAPINEIQFPTVTVCEEVPPDNWALPEKILNLLAFECKREECRSYPPSVPLFLQEKCQNPSSECINSTEKIRKDFEFMIRTVVKEYWNILKDESIDIPTTMNEPRFKYIKNVQNIGSFNISGLLDKAAELIGQGKSQKFEDAAVQYFGKDVQVNEMDLFVSSSNENTNCQTDICQNNTDEAIRRLLFLRDSGTAGMPLGSFLTQFIHLNKFNPDTFGSCRNEKEWDVCHDKIECNKLKTLSSNQAKIHEYLATLSRSYGFSESELISLYELPGMLAHNIDYHDESDNLIGDTPQAFLYSTCKVIDKDVFRYYNYGHDVELCQPWNKKPNETECSTDEKLVNGWVIPCCTHRWTDKMGQNLKSFMKVMRFAARRGKTEFNLDSVLPNISTSSEDQLKYPKDKNSFKQKSTQYDHNAMVPYCGLNAGKETLKSWALKSDYARTQCNLLQPVVTDYGLCHSFNAKAVSDVLTPSYFVDSFNDAFGDDLLTDDIQYKGNGSGTKHALNLVLAGNRIQRKNLKGPSEFIIGLTSDNDYFDLNAIKQNVRAGYHTTFTFQAMKIEPDSGLATIPLEKRKCRMENEVQNLTMVKTYSQSACKLEKKIEHAEEFCNCVPWFYPSLKTKKSDKYTICDKIGNHCFKTKMEEKSISLEVCPTSCKELRYISSQVIDKLDPIKECSNDKTVEYMIAKQLHKQWTAGDMRSDDKPLLLDSFEQLAGYLSSKDKGELKGFRNGISIKETCKLLIAKDIARVSIMFESEKYMLTKSNVRVTFVDRLSTFGGTLGLFTGMSILSMCEVCFWILKVLLKTKDLFPLSIEQNELPL